MILIMQPDPLFLLETWLAEAATLRSVQRGDILFRVGEKPTRVYWVRQGELHLIRYGAQGERAILQRCTRGPLAEAAMFSARYHCEGVAIVDSELWSMPLADFLDALTEPALGRAYMAWLSLSVRALRGQCERLSLPRAEDRVLHALRESGAYDLTTGTLKTWAAALGITHEHLYRTLARLERSGLIRRDAAGVYLAG